ncbi:MAG: hypothetical protein WBM34_03125, partial [Woeseiaceae bacterium]
LALDHGGRLVYIAPTRVNLNLTEERWPEIRFLKTREHKAPASRLRPSHEASANYQQQGHRLGAV